MNDTASKLAAWTMTAQPAELLTRALPGRPQHEIAKVLGVTQPSVSDWTTGKIEMSRSVRVHLLRILGVAWIDKRWQLTR